MTIVRFVRVPDRQLYFMIVHLTRISDSCGYGVPLYEYREQRSQLKAWTERKGEEAIKAYQLEVNSSSIDGLLGLRPMDSPHS